MIVTAFGLIPRVFPAQATIRPLWAANGTGTVSLRSEAACTFTATSSPDPRAPVKTTFVTPRSREPLSLSLPPFRTRPPDMQPAAHAAHERVEVD